MLFLAKMSSWVYCLGRASDLCSASASRVVRAGVCCMHGGVVKMGMEGCCYWVIVWLGTFIGLLVVFGLSNCIFVNDNGIIVLCRRTNAQHNLSILRLLYLERVMMGARACVPRAMNNRWEVRPEMLCVWGLLCMWMICA